MPGLAHFCEHLLFMGSTQFPQENAYSEFIHAHGGNTNAWTAASNTNYFFSIGADHLSGALQRFSGFFHSPLFEASCTTRELNAVNSEHKKNAQSDMWRAFQVSKALSRPGHPYAKFGSGNLHSLTYAGRTKGKQLDSASGPAPTQGGVNSVPAAASDEAEVSLQGEDGGLVGQETRRRLVEWWEAHYSASNMNLVILGKGLKYLIMAKPTTDVA
jgi:insulysin